MVDHWRDSERRQSPPMVTSWESVTSPVLWRHTELTAVCPLNETGRSFSFWARTRVTAVLRVLRLHKKSILYRYFAGFWGPRFLEMCRRCCCCCCSDALKSFKNLHGSFEMVEDSLLVAFQQNLHLQHDMVDMVDVRHSKPSVSFGFELFHLLNYRLILPMSNSRQMVTWITWFLLLWRNWKVKGGRGLDCFHLLKRNFFFSLVQFLLANKSERNRIFQPFYNLK